MSLNYTNLEIGLLNWLKANPELILDDPFYEEINQTYPCEKRELGHTLRMLAKEGLVNIKTRKDEAKSSDTEYFTFNVYEITREGLLAIRYF